MDADRVADTLRDDVAGNVRRDVPFGELTTFRVGGPAAFLVEAVSDSDLAAVGEIARQSRLPILAVGRGSNLLVADSGFSGIVVKLGRQYEELSSEADSLVAGGAARFPQAANYSARRGLAGLEFAIAIPGSVGGSVRMNAGAHGSQVSEVLEVATVLDLSTGKSGNETPSSLQMRYRHSALGDHHVVISATFRLSQADRGEVTARMEGFRRHRAATQPSEGNNAGSMFKNPADGSAGRLIEEAGLKETALGAAMVSPKHANFFIARPGASAQDVYNLMALVQTTVNERFGVMLEPEVRMVGEFDTSEHEVTR